MNSANYVNNDKTISCYSYLRHILFQITYGFGGIALEVSKELTSLEFCNIEAVTDVEVIWRKTMIWITIPEIRILIFRPAFILIHQVQKKSEKIYKVNKTIFRGPRPGRAGWMEITTARLHGPDPEHHFIWYKYNR